MIRLSARRIILGCAVAGASLASGCTRDHKVQSYSMWNESRYKPYEQAAFFENNTTSQPLVPGTVARGQLRTNDALYTGRSGGKLVTAYPMVIDAEVLKRGQERYTIFCAPCHAALGDGNGMIVKRGFAKPPDYAIVRLRNAPVGHFYDVITNGYGAMYSYAARVKPHDRWAIAAYIRVLQKARPDTPPDVRDQPRSQPEPGEGTEGVRPEEGSSPPTGGIPQTAPGGARGANP